MRIPIWSKLYLKMHRKWWRAVYAQAYLKIAEQAESKNFYRKGQFCGWAVFTHYLEDMRKGNAIRGKRGGAKRYDRKLHPRWSAIAHFLRDYRPER